LVAINAIGLLLSFYVLSVYDTIIATRSFWIPWRSGIGRQIALGLILAPPEPKRIAYLRPA
jgi:hypothetical protein